MHAFNLGKREYFSSDSIKACVAAGRNAKLNKCGNLAYIRNKAPIDNSTISADNAFVFKRGYLFGNIIFGDVEYNGYLDNIDDSIMLFYISDVSDATSMQCIDVEAPYEAEGAEGIWSIAKINDVYLDSTGKLNVIYASYHFDLDDKDRAGNPELIADTLKHYHAVYENGELLSRDELKIDGLTRNDSIRIAETNDGTLYLVTCNLQRDFENLGYSILRYCNGRYPEGGEAYVSVYCETEDGWKLAVKKDLGQFAADGFFIGDSQNSDSVDCLIYASDNDVYHLNISFEAKN